MVEVTEDVDEEERVRSFPQWNYSDEEFEEDFEEDLDSDHYEKAEEVPSSPIEQDVLQAIAAENQDLSHAQAALPSAPSPPSHFSPAHKVDFSFRQMASRSPVRISAIANKRVQSRARELLELVELDTLSFTLLELQPLSEYDVYMRNYGCSGTRQVSGAALSGAVGAIRKLGSACMHRLVCRPERTVRKWHHRLSLLPVLIAGFSGHQKT